MVQPLSTAGVYGVTVLRFSVLKTWTLLLVNGKVYFPTVARFTVGMIKEGRLKDMIKKLEVSCYIFAVVAVIVTIIF